MTSERQGNESDLLGLGKLLMSGINDCKQWDDVKELMPLLVSPNVLTTLQLDTPVSTQVRVTLSESLLRVSYSESKNSFLFDYDILGEVTRFFHLCNWTVTSNPRWDHVLDGLISTIGNDSLKHSDRTGNILLSICIESLVYGPAIALDMLFQRTKEKKFIWCHAMSPIGSFLWQNGFYTDRGDEDQLILWSDIQLAIETDRDEDIYLVTVNMLDLLCFDKKYSHEWIELVFNAVALPMMLLAIKHQRFSSALAMENFIETVWPKKLETADHYDKVFQRWVPQMIAAGKTFAAQNLPQQVSRSTPPCGKPIVGFIVPQASNLAHIDFMFSALHGLNAMGTECPLTPRIYVIAGYDEKMAQRCSDLGVEVTWVSQCNPKMEIEVLDGGNTSARLLLLREVLAQDSVTAIIWLSVLPMMAFAFELKLAPVQIWLSVRFWPSSFINADGNITVAAGFAGNLESQILYGQEWRSVPCVFTDLYDSTKEAEAHSLRDTFRTKHELLIGTISREEKTDNGRFLDVVSSILRANPTIGFIYTGRELRHNIHDHFEREGVGDQCSFIGWVNTKLYAQVLDIFLSTWPIGSGLTIYESLAASTPVVHFRGDGTILDWIDNTLSDPTSSLEDQELYHPFLPLITGSNSNQDYVDHVQRLIDRPDVRQFEGEIGKSFADEHLSNVAHLGQVMAMQITSIIDEKLDQKHAAP